MPIDAPFHLGPFLVDQSGRLTPRSVEASPGFAVRWRNRPIRARLERTEDDLGRLALLAVVGRIPSTAGRSGETSRRPRSFDVLRGLRRGLPAGWRLKLQPDHSAVIESTPVVILPVTAVSLVTALTGFILELTPYLDMLDETGMQIAEGASQA